MKIIVHPLDDGYQFYLTEDDYSEMLFASRTDNIFLPSVKEKYKYAWEAQRDALKTTHATNTIDLIYSYKTAQDSQKMDKIQEASAEQMLVDHYQDLLSSMEDRSRGVKGDKILEKETAQEIDMIESELKSVIEQMKDKREKAKIGSLLKGFQRLRKIFFGIKTASVNMTVNIDDTVKKELLYEYGYKICKAIEDFHKGSMCFIEIARHGSEIIVKELKENSDKDLYKSLLGIRVNENLNVDGIVPLGEVALIYPYHSVEFYQKYWKPIVESIGHFYLEDVNILLVPSKSPLPDIPNVEDSFSINGWDVNNLNPKQVDISFRGDSPTWIFETSKTQRTASVSKYTEQDYLNALVKCIDPKLQSIYGRSGVVDQILPLTDMILLDVNFERGLGNVRLAEYQVEII